MLRHGCPPDPAKYTLSHCSRNRHHLTTLPPPATSPTGARHVPRKCCGGGTRHYPGTRRGRHPTPGRNLRTASLTSAPHGPMHLPFPTHDCCISRTDLVFADLHGSEQVREPAQNGARPARPEGCRWPACWRNRLRTCMSSAVWQGRCVMGSLLAGIQWNALRLAACPSFRNGSLEASPEPGPGGCGGSAQPGQLPSLQTPGAAKRFGPSCACGFAAAPPRPLFRTRNNVHRSC